MLKKMGSFYIGGRKVTVANRPIKSVYKSAQLPLIDIDENGDHIVESSYIQYFIPTKTLNHNVIFAHGGGLTSAIWETTPDGRDGWLCCFLNKHFSCYLADDIGTGRSGWFSIAEVWKDDPEMRTAQRTWDLFRIGKREDFIKRQPFPNSQFPVNCFDNLLKYNVPRWHYKLESSIANLAELLGRIGKSTIISHSRSSESVLHCAERYPDLINNIVLIEPASFPLELNSKDISHIKFSFIYGDNIKANPYWQKIYDNGLCFTEKLKQYHPSIEWLHLPDLNIYGNTHQLMMDRNNEKIATMIVESIMSS